MLVSPVQYGVIVFDPLESHIDLHRHADGAHELGTEESIGFSKRLDQNRCCRITIGAGMNDLRQHRFPVHDYKAPAPTPFAR